MHTMRVYAVILAGGEGSRFAPLSTPENPKQFLRVLSPARSMIQQTLDRLSGWLPAERVYVSTNRRYGPLVRSHLPEIAPERIIGEPLKRNTAPPIALLTRLIALKDPEAVVLFLPADHFIADTARAVSRFNDAVDLAGRDDVLVTFGVPPVSPSSQYGYIRCTSVLADGAGRVEKFVEKPDAATAGRYLAEGGYYWNSGMFAWRASVFLQSLRRCMPGLYALLESLPRDLPIPERDVDAFFERADSISIDYGLLEKADNVAMLRFEAGWSDVGTWGSLAELAARYPLELPDEVLKQLNRSG